MEKPRIRIMPWIIHPADGIPVEHVLLARVDEQGMLQSVMLTRTPAAEEPKS